MPRRPHRKSRSGCTDCKRRHIKCDEHRPRCVNCQTAGLKCAFSSGASPQSTESSAGLTKTANSSGSNASTPAFHPPEAQETRPVTVEPPDPGMNMLHLELLHHFTTTTYRTFTPVAADQDIWRLTTIQLGLAFPFLMYELLAISALHMAYCKPERGEWYFTKSTELQSQALNIFNSVQREVDENNCAAVLMFTSLLGLHILADPSRVAGLNYNDYLDHFIGCLQLMRSVRSLVIERWAESLKEGELKVLFNIAEPKPPYDTPEPCKKLTQLVEQSDLTPEARESYGTAIERLHWIFALSNIPRETHNTIRWLLAWPIQLRDGYLDMLNQRRPEALIILAYYGVLMTFYRESWAVGDSGKFLIQVIGSHLGPHWNEWMAWPRSFLDPAEATTSKSDSQGREFPGLSS